jgi:hypothetical protein
MDWSIQNDLTDFSKLYLVQLKKYNLTWRFQRDGTVQLFGTEGQKFPSCPGTKGQRDKLKFFPREGTGRNFDRLSRDGTAGQLYKPIFS